MTITIYEDIVRGKQGVTWVEAGIYGVRRLIDNDRALVVLQEQDTTTKEKDILTVINIKDHQLNLSD